MYGEQSNSTRDALQDFNKHLKYRKVSQRDVIKTAKK